jgi:hypothetical protein
MLSFSLYPETVFDPGMRWIFYTLLPSGFIAFVPGPYTVGWTGPLSRFCSWRPPCTPGEATSCSERACGGTSPETRWVPGSDERLRALPAAYHAYAIGFPFESDVEYGNSSFFQKYHLTN